MYYAILADIHSNLTAFKAVLEDIEKQWGLAEIWCLGDVVGYGPDPHECINLLQQYPHVCIAGNHDLAAAGMLDTTSLNPNAAEASNWTTRHLNPSDFDYLANLPLILQRHDFTLVHGSPRDSIWEYLTSVKGAAENMSQFDTKYCLVGHTHVPLVFEENIDGKVSHLDLPSEMSLDTDGRRLIINPGGVGQPRDGNPLASYALFDSSENLICHRRVAYDIASVQERIKLVGLPLKMATRLSYGL